jgi:hypothetical protein
VIRNVTYTITSITVGGGEAGVGGSGGNAGASGNISGGAGATAGAGGAGGAGGATYIGGLVGDNSGLINTSIVYGNLASNNIDGGAGGVGGIGGNGSSGTGGHAGGVGGAGGAGGSSGALYMGGLVGQGNGNIANSSAQNGDIYVYAGGYGGAGALGGAGGAGGAGSGKNGVAGAGGAGGGTGAVFVGGVIGYNTSLVSINNLFSDDDIYINPASGGAGGSGSIGINGAAGSAGGNGGSGGNTQTTATVAGGLIGYLSGVGSIVKDSYSTGNITIYGDSGGAGGAGGSGAAAGRWPGLFAGGDFLCAQADSLSPRHLAPVRAGRQHPAFHVGAVLRHSQRSALSGRPGSSTRHEADIAIPGAGGLPAAVAVGHQRHGIEGIDILAEQAAKIGAHVAFFLDPAPGFGSTGAQCHHAHIVGIGTVPGSADRLIARPDVDQRAGFPERRAT